MRKFLNKMVTTIQRKKGLGPSNVMYQCYLLNGLYYLKKHTYVCLQEFNARKLLFHLVLFHDTKKF